MKRLDIQILGISEMRWLNSGKCIIDNYHVYYSGEEGNQHRNGVGFILSPDVNRSITSVCNISDRVIMIQLKSSPFNINLVQVYAPTSQSSEEDIETFYSQVEIATKTFQDKNINIILGDLNAKVGEGQDEDVIGPYGLGNRNDRGDKLVEFCKDNQMCIMNTYFKLPKRRLYTWTHPAHRVDNVIRNQIDFIIIKKRFRNAIKYTKTYPGADVGSDHNLLVSYIRVRLKKIINRNKTNRPNLEIIENSKENISNLLQTKISNIEPKEEVNEQWLIFKNVIQESIPDLKQALRKKKTWMTDEILNLMDQRRRYKNQDEIRYNNLNKEIRRKIRDAKSLWIEGKCNEIEELERKHDSFNLHKKVKEMTNLNRKPRTGNLINEQGNLVVQEEEKIKVWEKYVTDLFTDQRDEYVLSNIESGTEISMAEIDRAIQKAKNKKACGPDEIPAELLKMLQANGKQYLLQMFNKIYETGIIPEDWLKSTFITLPKKSNAKKMQ